MKKVLAVILCICMMLPLYSFGTVMAAGFTDLNGHWARNYVMPLYQKGIISGKSETTFDPEASVTRAEFLMLALKVPHIRALSFESVYSDVTEEQWFSKTVTEAAHRDIIPAEMIVNNNLLPDQPITREEMTAVLVRLWEGLRGNIKAGEKVFTDQESISAWTQESVQKAVSLGVITGNTDGSFNPLGLATRAEMAVMFKRLYDKCQTPIEPTAAGEYSPVYKGIIREDVDIQKLISDAYNSGAGEVTLPEGIFRVPARNTTHIDLSDMRNFTVKGNNTTLLFQEKTKFGFYANGAYNVKVENLTVDYEIPVYTQGEIIAIDPDGFYFDLWVDPAYPCKFKSSDTISGDFYTAEGLLSTDARSTGFDGHLIEQVEGNTWRVKSPKVTTVAKNVNIGDYFVFRASEKANTFYIEQGDGFHLSDVTIHSGDVAVVEGYGNETIRSTYDNVKIVPGPTPLGGVIPRLTSVSGTGFHMNGLRESFSVTNSIIEANGDDGTNIHGVYSRVGEKVGKNTYMIAVQNIRQLLLPGDVLRFYTSDYGFLDKATVVSSEAVNGYTCPVDVVQNVGVWTFTSRQWYKVVLDREPKVEFPGWVVNENEMCNGFEIKNTSFTNGRARGMLIKASGTIDNCLIDRRSIGLMIAPELYWLESDYADKVVVTNTTISNSGFGASGSTPFGATIHCDITTGINTNVKSIDQGEVIFENCTFDNNFGVQLELREAKSVTVKNCLFKDSGNSTGHIIASHMGVLTLEGNTYEGSFEALQLGDDIEKVNK